MATWREVQAARESFGQEESPAGEGDETGANDPDAGDDTTRRLKGGAESDPMSEQTEPDGGSDDIASWREVQRARESFDSETSSDPTGGTGGAAADDAESGSGGSAKQQRAGSGLDEAAEETESPASAAEDAESVQDRFTSGGSEPSGGGDTGPARAAPRDQDDADAVRQPDPLDNPEVVLGGGTMPGGISGEGPARPPPEPGPGLEDTGADEPGGPRFRYEDEGGTYRLSERDIARELERDFLEENPDLSGEDVRVVRRGERFAVELTPGGRRRIEDETVADVERQLEEETGQDVEPGRDFQLVPTGDGYRVETTEEFQRDQATRQLEQSLEEQTGDDLTPGEDFTVVRTSGGGFEAQLSDEYVGQQVETQLEEQIGRQRAQSLGISPTLLGDTTVLADVERGRDFTIERDEGRVSADLSEEFQEELALEFAEREIEGDTGADIDAERDLETSQAFDDQETRRYFRGDADAPPEPSVRVSLTEAGVETVVDSRQEEYGDVEIRDAADVAPLLAEIPFVGGALAGGARAAGDRVAISDLPRDASLQTESVERDSPGPGPVQTRTEQRVTGVTVDTFEEDTTVEDVLISGQRGFRQFATDVAEANLEYNPFAAAAVDAAGTFGYEEEAETVTRSAVREGVDTLNPARFGLLVKETGEFVPYAARETAAGRLGITIEPERAAAYDESVIQIEEGGLAPRVAEDVEEGARAFADYARENPFEVGGGAVGSLIVSGAVMGGAAAVSSRAGLATRTLIQPGEEALGYGGYYATRAVSSERAASRLFPQQEPLIFSEEAAIMGARYAGRRASEAGAAARARVPDVSAPSISSVRTELRSAPLNIAAARYNIGRRLRGESTSFRQRAVRGELGEEDIQATAAEEVDVPTMGDGDPGPSGGGSRVGGTFEIERQTDSGVVVERIRMESETEAFGEPTAELAGEFETGRRIRRETAVDPLGEAFEPTVFEPTISAEMAGSELMTETGLMAGLEFELGGRSDLVGEQESEVVSELFAEQRAETEPFVEQRLELATETELEQEFEFELKTETETELEVEGDERDRRPDDSLLGEDAGWGRTVQRELINPITGE